MPAPYSMDLRTRVIAACKDGRMTDEEVAEAFSIGEATVHRWKQLNRETGAVTPLAHGGGNPSKVDEAGMLVVCQLVQEQPDATAQEIRDAFAARTGSTASRSSIVRALKRLGLSRKKRR